MEIKCDEFNITTNLEVITRKNEWKKGCTSIVGHFTLPSTSNLCETITIGQEIQSPLFINSRGFRKQIDDRIIITTINVATDRTGYSFCNRFEPEVSLV